VSDSSRYLPGESKGAITYRVTHQTVYEYAEPVTVSHHAARMKPRVTATQSRDGFQLRVEPEPTVRRRRTDYFGNRLFSFSIQVVHERLEVVATSRVSRKAEDSVASGDSPRWEQLASTLRDPVTPDRIEPYQFVFDSPLICASPELADFARACFPKGIPFLEGVKTLNQRIHEDFVYDPVATTVTTPLREVLKRRRGVCQDFAHLAIGSLRSLGLPARYVSGYLRTRPPEGKDRLIGADASHAWFAVHCPELGWMDFDPTNNLMAGVDHITVAVGRDFSDVTPLCGILTGGGAHTVKVGVDVEVLDEGT
jgi:transglutaminase-like putative cysteine protease